jgi:hypothetical protein
MKQTGGTASESLCELFCVRVPLLLDVFALILAIGSSGLLSCFNLFSLYLSFGCLFASQYIASCWIAL